MVVVLRHPAGAPREAAAAAKHAPARADAAPKTAVPARIVNADQRVAAKSSSK